MGNARQTVRDWLWPGALAAYLALMFYVSSQPQIRPPLSFRFWDKAAHLVEYALLGFLAQRAAARLSLPGWLPSAAVAAAFGVLVGGLDEVYQGSVHGRHSSAVDFAFDCVGVAMGLAIARLTMSGSRKGRERP